MTGLFVSGRSWRRSAGRGSIWGLVINRSNFPLCKTRALLGLIKDEYHRSQITRRRPYGERWPAAWRNHNPYSDRILTSTARQIKKSRVSHSDSDFFHLNLSLNRKITRPKKVEPVIPNLSLYRIRPLTLRGTMVIWRFGDKLR